MSELPAARVVRGGGAGAGPGGGEAPRGQVWRLIFTRAAVLAVITATVIAGA